MARLQESSCLEYIRNIYAQEDDILINTKQSAAEYTQSIQVSAEEGKLIHLLLKLHKAKNVLEIGTCTGYSTIWIARALPEDGKVVTIEKDPKHYHIALQNFKNAALDHKISTLNGDAIDLLHQQKLGQYDAVFIDANKKAYPEYLQYAHKALKNNGLLIADNTLLFGQVYNQEVKDSSMLTAMKQFNLLMHEHFDSVIIPTNEGLSIGIKK